MLVKHFYLVFYFSNLIKTVNINVNDFEALIFKILSPPGSLPWHKIPV